MIFFLGLPIQRFLPDIDSQDSALTKKPRIHSWENLKDGGRTKQNRVEDTLPKVKEMLKMKQSTPFSQDEGFE